MSRLMLDTCVVFEMLLDFDSIDKNVLALLEDKNCMRCVSFETLRELIVLFNNKKIRAKKWKTAQDIISTVKNDLDIKVLPLCEDVADTYSHLQINEELNHYDPSDHIIISHTITLKMPLISSDRKFPFYRRQGLDLIEC